MDAGDEHRHDVGAVMAVDIQIIVG